MGLRWGRYQEHGGGSGIVWEGDVFSLDPDAEVGRQLVLGLVERGLEVALVNRGRRDLDPAADPRLASLAGPEGTPPATLRPRVVHVLAGQPPCFGPAGELAVYLDLGGAAPAAPGAEALPRLDACDLPLGVDSRVFRPGVPSPVALPETIRFLFVPGEAPEREWATLVEAARRAVPEAALVVLHPNAVGIPDPCPWPGIVPAGDLAPEALAGLYGHCHALVHLGRRRRLGRVLEAMACGLPVVAGPEFGDPELSAAGVLTLLDGDRPPEEALGAALAAVARAAPEVRAGAATAEAFVRHRRTWRRAAAALAAELPALGRDMPAGPLRPPAVRVVRTRRAPPAGGRPSAAPDAGDTTAVRETLDGFRLGGGGGQAWRLGLAPGQTLRPEEADAWYRQVTYGARVPTAVLDVTPADDLYGLDLIHPAVRLVPAGLPLEPDSVEALDVARLAGLTAPRPPGAWLEPDAGRHYHGLHRRAVGLAAQGRAEDAIVPFRDAWLRAPEHYRPMVVRNLAWALWRVGQPQAAFAIVRDGARVYPGYTDLEYVRGVIYARLGDFEVAAERFRACLDRRDAAPWQFAQPGLGTWRAALALCRCQLELSQGAAAIKSALLALHYNARFEPAIRVLAGVHPEDTGVDLGEVMRILESLVDRTQVRCLVALAETYAALGLAAGVQRIVGQGLAVARRGPPREVFRRLEAEARRAASGLEPEA